MWCHLHNMHTVNNEIVLIIALCKRVLFATTNTDNYELKIILKPDFKWLFNNSFPSPW